MAGALCLLDSAARLQFEQAGLFALLATLGIATSAIKIDLPLGRSQSNLSLSHTINFWALLALGPAPAVFIATISAWTQCTFRVGARNPLHRILFNIGSLTLTAWLAGLPIEVVMGWGAPGFAALARTASVIAPLYFFSNTILVAGAIALSTRQPLSRVWHRNFFWSAPSYLAGAALAALATGATRKASEPRCAASGRPLSCTQKLIHSLPAAAR